MQGQVQIATHVFTTYLYYASLKELGWTEYTPGWKGEKLDLEEGGIDVSL